MCRTVPRALALLALGIASPSIADGRDGPDSLAGSRPNIVVIMTDDQGYAPIGRHGHPWIKTPNLDALHDSSLRFTRFLVSPTCAPTRSALMTGRHPMRNGVTHTILERERMTLDAVTLPSVLRDAGYATAIFGKWHLGDEDPYQPRNRGFDETFIHGGGGIGQVYPGSCADAPDNRYFNPIIRHNGTFVRTSGFCTDVFFDSAIGWIDGRREEDRPFFAYIATNAPHAPYYAPESNRERFRDLGFSPETAGFYGMIENVDENVGRLLAKLDQWGLLEDTLIVFLSDNGMAAVGPSEDGAPLGHRLDGTLLHTYNAGMKGLKGSVDEGGVRVPCYWRWDGRIEPGREIDRIAAHIDLMPTLAAIAGAELPAGQVEGRSLLPMIEGHGDTWEDRYLFTHKGRWPKGADPDDFKDRDYAVRNQRFRLIDGNALYDMEADPGQTTNVIADHPEVAASMRAAYNSWWSATRPLMVNEDVPLAPTRPFHEAFRVQLEERGIPEWQSPAAR